MGGPELGLTGLAPAVKNTACPLAEGFIEEETVVVVARSTAWLRGLEVEPVKSPSPT